MMRDRGRGVPRIGHKVCTSRVVHPATHIHPAGGSARLARLTEAMPHCGMPEPRPVEAAKMLRAMSAKVRRSARISRKSSVLCGTLTSSSHHIPSPGSGRSSGTRHTPDTIASLTHKNPLQRAPLTPSV